MAVSSEVDVAFVSRVRLHVDMKSNALSWSIGRLAAHFGLATHVLRHWEDAGLLNPVRDRAGRRQFGEADVTRVAIIIRSKRAGMSLQQIHALLDGHVADRHAVLTAHLRDLDERMAEMAHSRHMTLHALDCPAHDIATCPNFAAGVTDILAG
jgi:MerR family copper efflux transcriptional regulator